MRTRLFLGCFLLLMMSAERLTAQLTAAFSADRVAGCAPIRVQFTDESTGDPTEWRWDLGNGTLSPLKNPSATYFTPGTYTIKLVVRKGIDSAVLVKTNYITVYGLPQINFSSTPQSGCLPLNVQFTDASTAGSGTITSWKWDFGDGILGSGQNPNHIYTTQGNYEVTLTVTNSNGCFNSASKFNYITGFDSIKASFGIVAPKACTVPATFSFLDSSNGDNIVFYEWDFGDGSKSNLKNPNHTYNVNGIYDITLRVRNSSGCEDVLVKKQVANAGNYKADFTTSSSVCIDKPVTFINTSNPLSLLDSVRWSFGNGQTSTQLNPTITYPATGSYTVKLVSKFSGCADSVSKTINVLSKPTIDFDATPKGACKAPLTVSFNSQIMGGTVVKWDFGNGATSTQANPTYTYNTSGVFDVKLIVQSPGGCLDTLVKTEYIKLQQPVINGIDGLPYRGCFPFTNQFGLNVSSEDPIVGWQWDFGDGTASDLSNPTHTYTDTGSYNVKATITTSQGCTSTLNSTVHGGSKPKAMFQGAPNIICPMDPVQFEDLSTGDIDKWEWHFGDGGQSSDINPIYKYNDTGWMNVVLIISSNGCADTAAIGRYIYVKPPIASFLDSFVCGNQFRHSFTENATGATYWKWYIDSTDSIEARNIDYIFADTGFHTIKLFVSTDECEHESVKELYILDEKADFIVKDSGDCASTFVTFTALGPKTHPEYIKEYEWSFGDNSPPLIADTFVVTHEYRQKGNVQVSLKITDINGCSDSLLLSYDVQQYGPIANFGPAYTAICAGTEATFIDSSSAGIINPIASWQWNFGDGSSQQTFTGPPFAHTYDNTGFFDVTLKVVDELGCADSITRNVAMGVYKPKANFYSPDTLICIGAPVDIINQSTGSQLKALWDFGNGKTGTTINGQTSYASAGKYDVTLIVSDTINCKDTLFRPQYITAGNAVANFDMSDSFTTCPPLVVIFSNNSFNNVNNAWSFGNGNTSTFVSPSHTYTKPGIFNVKLVVTGNGGCKDSITRKIAIQGPSGQFSYGPLSGCPPLVVDFVANAINTQTITWDFSDGNSLVTTDSIAKHVYDLPGVYVPKVIFADTIACKLPVQGPDTIFVVGAKAFARSLPRYNYCDTATISFFDSTVTTDIITSYLWDFGDGTTSNLRDPVHFFAQPGNYQVVLEVRTFRGCVSRDTLFPNIYIAPTPIFNTSPRNPICIPASVQFNASWINPDTSKLTYRWDFGNGTSSTQLNPNPVTYTIPGNISIKFSATNSFGCTGTSDFTLRVNDTPRITVGPAAFICRTQPHQLMATGANTYQWAASGSLSCLNCSNPVARPLTTEVFTVVGTDTNNCRATKSVEINVKQPTSITVGKGDTLCVGESFKLQASGAERYLWQPPAGLSSTTIASPTAAPATTTRYMVIGYDSLNCFSDTGYISIVVYPIPKFNIIEDEIVANTGSIVPINTTSSADITRWHWTPPFGLNCTNCPEPSLTVGNAYTYTARVFNDGGCTAVDKLTVKPICSGENVFIPNTFSPNGDGQNDVFYPRGKGIAIVKSMHIFNRWGELLYEAKEFAINDRTKGWNGIYKGVLLSPDVYVYTIEVLCDNSYVFTLKGNVTLLR